MLLLFQMIGATGGAVCEGRITTCSEPVVIHQQPATRQLQLPPSTCHFYQATNLRTGFIPRTFTKGIPLGSVGLVMGPWQYMRYEMTKWLLHPKELLKTRFCMLGFIIDNFYVLKNLPRAGYVLALSNMFIAQFSSHFSWLRTFLQIDSFSGINCCHW